MVSVLDDVVDIASSLIKAHSLTLKQMFEPKITEHYPDERPNLPTGARGMPALKVNESGRLNCTGCGVCARACPIDVIDVEMATGEDGKKKREPAFFNLDMSRCLQCQLCVEACPFDALEMADQFELSVYHPEELVFDMYELAEIWKTHGAVRIAEGEKI